VAHSYISSPLSRALRQIPCHAKICWNGHIAQVVKTVEQGRDMAEDDYARLLALRARAEELRVERERYMALYREGDFTLDEVLPTLRAIAYEFRSIASEMRSLVPRPSNMPSLLRR
jgi:hypothetical protein